MLIIKPYGRSEVNEGSRQVKPHHPLQSSNHLISVEKLIKEKLELVIAHFISVIDKIAKKPKKGLPNFNQAKFREKLGNAVWKMIEEKRGEFLDKDIKDKFKEIWKSKIHPYGYNDQDSNNNYNKKNRKDAKKINKSIKGRWYNTFCSKEPLDIIEQSFEKLALDIYQHLFEKARFKKHSNNTPSEEGKTKSHPKGLMCQQANAISKNILKSHVKKSGNSNTNIDNKNYHEKYLEKYYQEDIAVAICQVIKNHKDEKNYPREEVAKELYQHYEKIFKDTGVRQGQENQVRVLTIKEVKKNPELSPLLDYHVRVKDFYLKKLKGSNLGKIKAILPKNKHELDRLLNRKKTNQDINALIRLGKVIHYHGSDELDGNDKSEISNSRYWGSEGQIEIKQNEAFVRIWKQFITFASRSLTNWIGSEIIGDTDLIGSKGASNKAVENANLSNYESHLKLFFGSKENLFSGSEEEEDLQSQFKKIVLWTAVDGTRILRNQIFHFKSVSDLIGKLQSLADKEDPSKEKHPLSFTKNFQIVYPKVLSKINELWEGDIKSRREKLFNEMEGAGFKYFLTVNQIQSLIPHFTQNHNGILYLPRFNRLYRRIKNIGFEPKFTGLEPKNKLEKNQSVFLYKLFQMIYQKSFIVWLGHQQNNSDELQKWIDKAIARTSNAAFEKNEKTGINVVARAAKFFDPGEFNTLSEFLDRIRSLTSSEMGIVSNYQSDPDASQNQAKAITDLECDVIILAFHQYLKEKLEWTLKIPFEVLPDGDNLRRKRCSDEDFSRLRKKEENESLLSSGQSDDLQAEEWQKVLYFLLHLAPVGTVNHLLLQLKKSVITRRKSSVSEASDNINRIFQPLIAVLNLYCEMHDAKYQGEEHSPEYYKQFYQKDLWEKIYLSNRTNRNEETVRERSIRELSKLDTTIVDNFFKNHIPKITTEDWNKYEGLEKKIEASQKSREELHENLVTEKLCNDTPFKNIEEYSKALDARFENIKKYCKVLREVIQHQRLTHRIYLYDLIKAYRLTIDVLARLVDFSWLWERDIYFTTLAVVNLNGLKTECVFTDKNLQFFNKGMIVEALRNLNDNFKTNILKQVENYFGKEFLNNEQNNKHNKPNTPVGIRNEFAHFNMLRKENLNLTELVNLARKLMSYDRKLKNAVSKSIKDILLKYGIEIEWCMDNHHPLSSARLNSGQIKHLQKMCFGGKVDFITENKAGQVLLDFMAQLFNGKTVDKKDISDFSGTDIEEEIKKIKVKAKKNWNKNHRSKKGGKNN